jgi:hypothetical protein
LVFSHDLSDLSDSFINIVCTDDFPDFTALFIYLSQAFAFKLFPVLEHIDPCIHHLPGSFDNGAAKGKPLAENAVDTSGSNNKLFMEPGSWFLKCPGKDKDKKTGAVDSYTLPTPVLTVSGSMG